MEGVGARLGRSSTRYGPATVFNGPVRKWKKRWVHVSPSNSNTNNNNNHSHSYNGTPTSTSASSNGNNGSHLLLYKWSPISQSTNNNINGNNSNGDKISTKGEVVEATDEPPRRKFKYIPVAVLEEQKNEAAEKVDDDDDDDDDDAKPIDSDPSAVEPTPKSEDVDEKPDINDLPMEESQSEENNQVVRQDLNESTLDLSLGR